MVMEIKNLNIPLPDRFALKDFVDRHSLTPHRAAVVQLRNRNLNLAR